MGQDSQYTVSLSDLQTEQFGSGAATWSGFTDGLQIKSYESETWSTDEFSSGLNNPTPIFSEHDLNWSLFDGVATSSNTPQFMPDTAFSNSEFQYMYSSNTDIDFKDFLAETMNINNSSYYSPQSQQTHLEPVIPDDTPISIQDSLINTSKDRAQYNVTHSTKQAPTYSQAFEISSSSSHPNSPNHPSPPPGKRAIPRAKPAYSHDRTSRIRKITPKADSNFVCTWPGCTRSYKHRKNFWEHVESVHKGVTHACGIGDCTYHTAKPGNRRRHWKSQHDYVSPKFVEKWRSGVK